MTLPPELVARTEGVQPWRRVVHAASGITLALGPAQLGLARNTTAALLFGGVAVALGVEVARSKVPALNRWLFETLRHLMSPREAAGVASSTWYLLGAALVWLAFPAAIAVPSLLVLGLADPAASVVGRCWGRRRLGKGTWMGSLVFFCVAASVLFATVGGPPALLAAAMATLVEVGSGPLDDNLTVPVATGLTLFVVLPTGFI